MTELNIIIPVFNEAENFPRVYRSIKERVKTTHRIFAVYDFDEDTTVPVVQALATKDADLILVKNTLGRGPLNALKTGFNAVKNGPVLVVMADLSDDLTDVDKMVELYRQGFSVVCGSRYIQGGGQMGGPFFKSLLSKFAGISLFYFRRFPTHDVTNNFKIYDSEFLKTIRIESTMGFSVAMEITVKAFLAGKKIAEVPTTWHNRTAGKSNFKLWKWLPQYLFWYFFAFQPKRKSM